MANDVEKKRKGLRQQVLANQQRAPGAAPARERIPETLPTPEAREAEVAGIKQQFADIPQNIEGPRGVSQRGFAQAEEAVPVGARPTPTPAAPTPGVRQGVGALPAHLASQPGYQEAAELRRTGPAGIRAGTVGKYAAGETPFSQEQFERARTVGQYEAGVPQLTPREIEAQQAAQAPQGVRAGGAGIAEPTFREQVGPRLSEQNAIARRYAAARRGTESTTVLARLTAQEGAEQAGLRESTRPNLEEAGLRQRADIAQAADVRAEKKLASEERRARLSGIRASGKAALEQTRFEEKRGTEQERYMTGRVDKAAADISTRLEDGERITIPGAEEEFRSFVGVSGGARSEGGLNVMKGLYKFGKAAQRAQGEAQNPLQSLRNVPILGGLIRGLDERGTPNINTAQVKAVLKSYDEKARTYKVGEETIDESALGLEKGMVGKLLRDMLK